VIEAVRCDVHVSNNTALAGYELPVAIVERLVDDYPRSPLVEAANAAAHYGLYDLDRLERMILRNVATAYFIVPVDRDDSTEEPSDEG